ncbi:MAG: D-alanine--D-alanine ligase [Bacteriovoracaceae bacterium]|jgi:D-alanine-D-alanine ligase|nr:D-alanine--D-alanine ligase [Bacteriovoracaceae bacterium]
MNKKNILLICGGGASEHEISLISAKYIKSQLEKINKYNIFYVEMTKDGTRKDERGCVVELRKGGILFEAQIQKETQLHFAIPCFHGPPGETGQIQSVFEMMKLAYLGCGPEASALCFNKISTKLWFNALNIPNSPFLFIDQINNENKLKSENFLETEKKIFVKSSSQGSSLGCYFVKNKSDLEMAIKHAFELSPYVLIEKCIEGRELEMAVYEYEGKVIATNPGEIIAPNQFYDFDQKYSKTSKAITNVEAKGLETKDIIIMKELAIKAFTSLKLRHLSRIDFFLNQNGSIYINEINTFPGMTPISMFPKMMESNEHNFTKFLESIIDNNIE